MTELLEQHFDTTFAAPDGIAKLRADFDTGHANDSLFNQPTDIVR